MGYFAFSQVSLPNRYIFYTSSSQQLYVASSYYIGQDRSGASPPSVFNKVLSTVLLH